MNEISQIIKKIKRLSESKKLMISSVESCTGGLISKLLTDFPGSSSFLTQLLYRIRIILKSGFSMYLLILCQHLELFLIEWL